MRVGSRPVAILALTLTMAFAPSTVCVALPVSIASQVTPVQESCHGHHGPMPAPSHNCCYAAHHVPAAFPIGSFLTALGVIGVCVNTSDAVGVQADLSARNH